MTYRDLSSFALVLIFGAGLAAQSKPVGGRTPSPNTRSPSRTTAPTGDATSGLLFLSGKVSVDDGTPLTDAAAIQSNCKGQVKTEVYTDSKGHFSFEFGSTRRADLAGAGQASDSSATPGSVGVRQNSGVRDWRNCDLRAVLAGFTSQVVDLGARVSDFENIDIGTIVLHRLAAVEGFTVSATSASAPSRARKDYEKGLEEEKKDKWDSAQEKFRKAVEGYPRYAVAWLELGRVQVHKNDLAAARQSFQQAIKADAKFISPYQELAQLAAHDKQWQELADLTGKVLALNPVNFPQYWFYNAVANFYLNHLDVAESSIRQGIRNDSQRRFPKMEYVLGTILARKHDYRGAAEHLHTYLSLSPTGPEVAEAQKQLEEVERLSAAAPNPKQ